MLLLPGESQAMSGLGQFDFSVKDYINTKSFLTIGIIAAVIIYLSTKSE